MTSVPAFGERIDEAPRGFSEAVRLLSAAVVARPAPSGLDDELALVRSLESDVRAPGTVPSSEALQAVVEAFGLDHTDASLLALAALAELEPRAAVVLGALDGRPAYSGLSVGSVVEVLSPVAEGTDLHARLTSAGDLVARGLVHVVGTGPWALREVVVADGIIDHLLEADSPGAGATPYLVGSAGLQSAPTLLTEDAPRAPGPRAEWQGHVV